VTYTEDCIVVACDILLCIDCVQKLNAIQELQALQAILSFFMKQNSDACRQLVFNMMFGTLTENEVRLSLLSKLVSMSVGVQNSALLNSSAVWMQVILACLCQNYKKMFAVDNSFHIFFKLCN